MKQSFRTVVAALMLIGGFTAESYAVGIYYCRVAQNACDEICAKSHDSLTCYFACQAGGEACSEAKGGTRCKTWKAKCTEDCASSKDPTKCKAACIKGSKECVTASKS